MFTIFNKHEIVFPGVGSGISGEMFFNRQFITTPYGLFMPSSSLSLVMLRELRHMDQTIIKSKAEIAKKSTCFNHGVLLSNRDDLESVYLDGEDLMVYPIDDKLDTWSVFSIKTDKAIPLTEMASQAKSLEEIIAFIDEFSGQRFIRPIRINRQEWLEEREKNGNILTLI